MDKNRGVKGAVEEQILFFLPSDGPLRWHSLQLYVSMCLCVFVKYSVNIWFLSLSFLLSSCSFCGILRQVQMDSVSEFEILSF